MNNIQDALNYLNQLEEEMISKSLSEAIENIQLDTSTDHIEISAEEKADEDADMVIEPLEREDIPEIEDELTADEDDDISGIGIEDDAEDEDAFAFDDLEMDEEPAEEDNIQEESLKEDFEEPAGDVTKAETVEVEVENEEPAKIKIEYDPEEVEVETVETPDVEKEEEEVEIDIEDTEDDTKDDTDDVVDDAVDDGEELEFDEESFDGLYEAHLKESYRNVKSYRTARVRKINEALAVTGKITFTSGNTGITHFLLRENKNGGYTCKNREIGSRYNLLSENINNKITFKSLNEEMSLEQKRYKNDLLNKKDRENQHHRERRQQYKDRIDSTLKRK